MKRKEAFAAFAAGCAGYPLLELCWRGRTHWSMAAAGGLSLLLVYPLAARKRCRLFCCKAAAVITAVELLFGIVFNIILKRNVWDYSKIRGNLWGQICLPYCLLWMLLAIPIRWLCRGLRHILKE